MRVSVIGGGDGVPADLLAAAREVGELLGERGHTLVCGGLGGVMAAACEGAKSADGETIGILPGDDPAAANPHVDTAVATGLGHARNALVVMNGDAVVAVDGGAGTLSELGFAGVFDRPVAGIRSHEADHVEACESAREAVDYVEGAVDTGDC